MRSGRSSGRRRRHHRPGAPRPHTPPAPSAPTSAAALGSPFFSQGVLQDGLVEAEVGDELLELPVLLAELAQLAHLRGAEFPEFLFPPVERQLRHLELPADLHD